MTLQEFNEINWHRGNVAKLKNGKEYLVKGTKGHGRWLLLYSEEYDKCFVADHKIVDCRTSDYEEPEEVYLEMKRQKQAEAQAKRDAERQNIFVRRKSASRRIFRSKSVFIRKHWQERQQKPTSNLSLRRLRK